MVKFNFKTILILILIILINLILFNRGCFKEKNNTQKKWEDNIITLFGTSENNILNVKFFLDYEDVNSKDLLANLLTLKKEDLLGTINLEIQNFPGIIIHPNSFDTAILVECLFEEWLWESFLENIWLKNIKYTNFDKCLAIIKTVLSLKKSQVINIRDCFNQALPARKIQADILYATKKGFVSTPILEIQGIKYEGVLTSDKLQYLFNSYLKGEKPDRGVFSGSCQG